MTPSTPRPETIAERQVAFRLASMRVGMALTALAASGSVAYALSTWDRPNRAVLIALAGAALATVPINMALPRERLIRSRWREPFFIAWTTALIAIIAGVTAADGGVGSPYTALFILPLIFAGLSYPPRSVVISGIIDVAAFAAVALVAPGHFLVDAFVGFALACGAVMCAWQAGNSHRQERELVSTADALSRSEATTRLREAQQQQIASFGQRALAGEPVEQLMAEMVAIIKGTLDVDVAAVLELSQERDHFVIAKAAGLPEPALGSKVPTGRRSQSGFTLITGEPVIVSDWTSEERFAQPAWLKRLGVVAGVTVPIKGRGVAFGALGVQSCRPREFGQDDVTFLVSMANSLASAIERRADEEEARHRALHDPLTGLPNRTLFADHLATALARQERRSGLVAVIFLDLDRFKLVNDSLGHQAGDELLRMVAPRLKLSLRAGDIVARFGGDEFAVLLDDIASERDATSVAERIAAVLGRPFVLEDREYFVTASMGIALGGSADLSEALIRDADAAMYRAKDLGRARYEIFDEALRFRLANRLRIENELRAGIDRGELRVHYQPVIALATGRIAGAEALVRWEHPERGLLPPSEFIEVSEESGLVTAMGRSVLEQACAQTASWQDDAPDAAPLGISVNVSALQLADPGFPEFVASVLRTSGLQPVCLSLELTEALVMEPSSDSRAALRALVELGVRLSLDDFGTGYSSLGYLKHLPLDTIKLDRSFIGSLGSEKADEAIVSAVVALGTTLGLSVVAEGVETAEQAELIQDLGCQFAQGFYFSAPVPADEFAALLREPAWVSRAR